MVSQIGSSQPQTSIPARRARDTGRRHIFPMEPITSTKIDVALGRSRRLSAGSDTGLDSQRQAAFLRCRRLRGSMFSLPTISPISARPVAESGRRTVCGAQGVGSLAGCDRTTQNPLQLARSLRGRRRTRPNADPMPLAALRKLAVARPWSPRPDTGSIKSSALCRGNGPWS